MLLEGGRQERNASPAMLRAKLALDEANASSIDNDAEPTTRMFMEKLSGALGTCAA